MPSLMHTSVYGSARYSFTFSPYNSIICVQLGWKLNSPRKIAVISVVARSAALPLLDPLVAFLVFTPLHVLVFRAMGCLVGLGVMFSSSSSELDNTITSVF